MSKLKRAAITVVAIIVLIVAVGFCVWMAISNRTQSGVPIEQALRDDTGNIVAGPNGEMFFEYSGFPGVAEEDRNEDGKPTSYYLSGVWKWNEKLASYPGLEGADVETIPLDFHSVRCKETSVVFRQYSDGFLNVSYTKVDSDRGYGHHYGWLDPTCRLLNLGDVPQQVSEEFYNYFLTNAVPATKEEYLAAVEQYLWEAKSKTEEFFVSGYWVWNEDIVFTKSERLHEWKMSGEFSTGQHFENFWFGEFFSGNIVMMYSKEENIAPAYECWNSNRGGWTSFARRYIYLGETPQTLTGDDYYFFIANATPCTREEFAAAAERYATNP